MKGDTIGNLLMLVVAFMLTVLILFAIDKCANHNRAINTEAVHDTIYVPTPIDIDDHP